MSLKRTTAIVLVISLFISLTACSSIGKTLRAQGRDYDNLVTQTIGVATENTFFEWTVNSVRVEKEDLDGHAPGEGMKYVIADITVKNTSDDDELPVGNYDFFIVWGESDSEEADALEEFYTGMYPDEVFLDLNETVSGDLVFEVPEEANSVSIIFTEIWTDNFSGNTYSLDLDLNDL